jgi:serine/threonine protein phosphatase PrpC
MPHTDPTIQVFDGAERRQPIPVRDVATASHRGHVRARNEDAWASDARLGLMLVADGVGGHGDGRRASTRAISLVLRFITRSARRTGTGTVAQRETIVTRALEFAHEQLRRENRRDGQNKPSGTTIVGLWLPVGGDMATAFNIGDSSLLHFWAGGAQKKSRDHSLHQLWLEGGGIGTEPSKRVIVQALGISAAIAPHIVSFPVVPGSVIVACTDGLTGTLAPERIASLLAGIPSAAEGAAALLKEVLAGRARDNVTVAVCRL